MKVKITQEILFSERESRMCYTVRYKFRWYQRWKYVKKGGEPRFFISLDEIDKYFSTLGFEENDKHRSKSG